MDSTLGAGAQSGSPHLTKASIIQACETWPMLTLYLAVRTDGHTYWTSDADPTPMRHVEDAVHRAVGIRPFATHFERRMVEMLEETVRSDRRIAVKLSWHQRDGWEIDDPREQDGREG